MITFEGPFHLLDKAARARIEPKIRLAMALAADVVVAEARANHDYKDRTSTLTNSMEAGPVQGSIAGGDLSVTLSAGAPYARFVDQGTRPHKIRPRRRKALRWAVEGGFAFAKVVNHPGTRPRRFFERAADRKEQAVLGILRSAVGLEFRRQGFDVR